MGRNLKVESALVFIALTSAISRRAALLSGIFAITSLALAGSGPACDNSVLVLISWLAAVILAATFAGLAIGISLISGNPRRKAMKVAGSVVSAAGIGLAIAYTSVSVAISACL